jgi:hypothetical protein
MRKLILTGKAILLCLLYLTATQAAPVPASLYGHWLKTDGSNQFVIGIYPNTACYKNKTWRINAAEEVQGRWQLHLEQGGKTATVTVQRRDSTTLLLGDGAQLELKNIRTLNDRYRPEQPAFGQQLFTEGSAWLRGLLQWKGKRPAKENYVQLSYNDMRTGKKEYLFADLDSLDRFSLRIPLHMPVFCTLSIGSTQAATFLVQPADTLLLAFNNTISLAGANPDYNIQMQRVCLMGSNAAFNNQYQHYAQYVSHLGFKPEQSASMADRKMPANVQYQQQYALYSKLYDSLLHRIDLVYPTYVAEQRFIDYIKAETRYNCVLALLENRFTDSNFVKKVYDQYLSQETPLALVHESYYKVASTYAVRLHDDDRRFRFRNSRLVNFDKITERVQKDLGPLLSPGFLERFNVIQKDWNSITSMKNTAVIQKYFNGSSEEAESFWHLFNSITDEFHKEFLDSAAYSLYETKIPNACLRFAANLQQLQNNINRSNGDIPVPSLYRISLFKLYSQLPGMPHQQVIPVNTAQALLLGAFNLQLKPDPKHVRQIDHEAEWQSALRAYRGKRVVIWTFPAGGFKQELAARSLYELQKLQEHYQGHNVVFLKCIRQRDGGDGIKQLLQYLDHFNRQGQLNNVFYVNRSLSVGTLADEAITDCCVIYDTSGLAHHPMRNGKPLRRRDYENITLPGELDSVLTGKGHYYEPAADYFLKDARNYGWDMMGIGKGKTWTLHDSTSHCYRYLSKEPVKSVYELNDDSVCHLLTFMQDSLCMESELFFPVQPTTNTRSEQLFFAPGSSKENMHFNPMRTYRYDQHKRLLRVYDGKKLFRTYRVAFITAECLVLELIQ